MLQEAQKCRDAYAVWCDGIGRKVSCSRKEIVQTAGTLHNPDHLNTVWDEAVEDEIAAHGKIPAVRGNVRSCWPQLRMVGEKGQLVLDLIQQAIRCAGVVLGNIQPEID